MSLKENYQKSILQGSLILHRPIKRQTGPIAALPLLPLLSLCRFCERKKEAFF